VKNPNPAHRDFSAIKEALSPLLGAIRQKPKAGELLLKVLRGVDEKYKDEPKDEPAE
jgi:hypothetical protein